MNAAKRKVDSTSPAENMGAYVNVTAHVKPADMKAARESVSSTSPAYGAALSKEMTKVFEALAKGNFAEAEDRLREAENIMEEGGYDARLREKIEEMSK